jgi:hypothetical protein
MTKSDRDIVISIVTRAFEENPRAQAMMKQGNPARSVRHMTEYAYKLVDKFDGIYLSEDKTTVLFYYRKSQYKRSLLDYIRYIIMFARAIRPSQFFPTMKREKYITSLRPAAYKDYIYVWVLASVPNNRSLRGLADIRDHLFGLSEKLNLPILIETTVEKVLKLYKYVGFEVYHHWHDKDAEIDVWFLERKLARASETPAD